MSCLFFCAADWGSPADSPIFEGHDQIWDSCRYGWRICYNCRKCHGGIHLIWGELKLLLHHIALTYVLVPIFCRKDANLFTYTRITRIFLWLYNKYEKRNRGTMWYGIQCAIVTVMEELTRQKKYILFQQQLSLATDKVALPENIIYCSTTE